MRILIADDDLTTRTILAGILKKWGFDVVAAVDGNSAWEVMQQKDAPSLALVDWVMPGMDGIGLIQKIREVTTNPPPYIILLSSRDAKDDVVSGLGAGANDYVKKPFDKDELIARIRVGERNLDLQTRLIETQEILAHLATHDPLTGILNRRAIMDQLSKELSRARRVGTDVCCKGPSVGFFDIDHFKQINDNYGHQAGDEILIQLSNLITAQLREYDSFGRLGGDEFLVIVPDVDEHKRKSIFERLLGKISSTAFVTNAGEIPITLSIGISTADTVCTIDQLLASADVALYRAKNEGRNRMYFAG